MLINEETKESLELVIQAMFQHNRMWDRALSDLNINWGMNKFEKVFHDGLAHKYPLLADNVSDILTENGLTTKYLETLEDNTSYVSPLEFFESNVASHEDTYRLIQNSIDIATKNRDYNVVAKMLTFLSKFNKYIDQACLLYDKSLICKSDYLRFDSLSEDFYIIGD